MKQTSTDELNITQDIEIIKQSKIDVKINRFKMITGTKDQRGIETKAQAR